MSMTKAYLHSLPTAEQDAILGHGPAANDNYRIGFLTTTLQLRTAELEKCREQLANAMARIAALESGIDPDYEAAWADHQCERDFNPNDCGGVFDGYGVVSDADPGL